MAQQVIASVAPNIGLQGEAIAGSSAVVFTATDRQIIKERAGEINRNRSFKEIFSGKGLLPEVENEETTVKPDQDVKQLAGRYREHRRMLKHAPLAAPREHVEITNEIPQETPSPAIPPTAAPANQPGVLRETAAMVEELNLNPAEVFDKFSLEQGQLHSLICRIKELHLKRLLSESREEFDKLSETIKRETIAAGRPEARDWLEAQLDKLTQAAAEYKLKLSETLRKFQ